MNQKIKNKFVKILNSIVRILAIFLSIGIFFGVIYFFIWGGWKGFTGFVVGVLVTGFIFMSDHPFIQVYREMILKNHK